MCPAENLIESSPCTAAGSSHAQIHTNTHTPVHISSGTSVRLRANDERSSAHAADANRLLLKYLHRLQNLVILSNTAGVKMSIRLASRWLKPNVSVLSLLCLSSWIDSCLCELISMRLSPVSHRTPASLSYLPSEPWEAPEAGGLVCVRGGQRQRESVSGSQ